MIHSMSIILGICILKVTIGRNSSNRELSWILHPQNLASTQIVLLLVTSTPIIRIEFSTLLKDNLIAPRYLMPLIFQAMDDEDIFVVIFGTLAIVITGGQFHSIQQCFLWSFSILIDHSKRWSKVTKGPGEHTRRFDRHEGHGSSLARNTAISSTGIIQHQLGRLRTIN